jgi:hypothetical protein
VRDIRSWLSALLLLVLVAAPVRADKEFDEMLKRVPSTANGIVLIDAESLYASQLGQKEGWKAKHQQEYLGGAVMFPSTATHALFAAQMDQFGSADMYEIGLAYLSKPVTMDNLAKFEGGSTETVSGVPVVRSPRNCYFVNFTPQVLGTYAPASRQEFSRWVKFGLKGAESSDLSPYLKDAAKKAGWKNQIVVAFDTTDMINPRMAKLHLAQMDAMSGKKDQLEGVAKLISSMHGISATITVTSKIEAELKVEFTDNIRPFASLLKPVLLEALVHKGAHIENLEAGEFTIGDNSLTLKGPMSEEGLRKILAIIQPPAAQTSPGDEGPGATPGVDPKLLASKRYYTSVSNMIAELKNKRVQKIQESGWWHTQYANKIDDLPILNVDPELLAWGGKISGMLRNIGASLQGVGLKNNALDAYRQETVYAWGPSYGGYGGWGGYGSYYQPGGVWYENNYQEIWAAGRENTTKGAQDRNEVWGQIDQMTGNIRKQMTLKYNTEF